MLNWLSRLFGRRSGLRPAPHLEAVAVHNSFSWPNLDLAEAHTTVYRQSPWVYVAINRIAEAAALRFAESNYPGIDPSTIDVSFRCIVGDRNNDNLPDAGDIPAVCDPGVGATNSWRCANGICAAVCDPDGAGTSCNTIVLSTTQSIDYRFGPAIGVGSGSTQQVLSAACVGPLRI